MDSSSETAEPLLRSLVRYDEPEEGANMAKTLLRAFKQHNHRALLIDSGAKREWTGGQLLDRTSRLATNLIKWLQVKTGDVVLMMCDHNDMEIVMALGAIISGCSLYGTTPEDGFDELSVLCEILRPNLIVTNSKWNELALKLRETISNEDKNNNLLPIIWVDETTTNGLDNQFVEQIDLNNNIEECSSSIRKLQSQYCNITLMEDLINGPLDEKLVESVVNERIQAKKHALTYMLTSGSTGHPKVVPSTHEELIHGMQSMFSATKYGVGSASRKQNGFNNKKEPLMPLSKDSILAGDLPLDHGAGVNTMFLSLILGAKFIVMPSYVEDSYWQAVNDYHITASISSTTFTYKLLARLKFMVESGEAKRWNLNSFEYLVCCGAKLAFTDLVNEINLHYPHFQVCQAYGCTEIGFMSILRVQDCKSHLNSVGHLFPGMICRVVDMDTNELVPIGEKGEFRVIAASKFKGYKCVKIDNPIELNANCHDEYGFYKTGDQVHFDQEQRLYIHGRFKDTLVLMTDWKILPIELEEVVDQHPLVEYSAVVGIPDKEQIGCDSPRAFVKLIEMESVDFKNLGKEFKELLITKDSDLIAKDIYNFVAERTAKPKHLRGGVRILEEFPRVGLLNKIDRKPLKQMN